MTAIETGVSAGALLLFSSTFKTPFSTQSFSPLPSLPIPPLLMPSVDDIGTESAALLSPPSFTFTPSPTLSAASDHDHDLKPFDKPKSKRAMDDSEREEKISRALMRVEEGLSYRQAAKEIGVSFGTVYGRFRGRKSRVKAQEARMKLTFLEETIIEKMLLTAVYIGMPYTQPYFVQAANTFLQAQGDSDPEKVTRQWYRHFRRRHPSMDAKEFSVLHTPASIHYGVEAVDSWFKKFLGICTLHSISAENMYCMDEFGFTPGPAFQACGNSRQNRSCNPFVSVAATTERRVESDNVIIPPPPANSFTMIETTGADGSILPPYVVLPESLFPQRTSLLDERQQESWQFRASKSGWINSNLIVDWIETHFDPLTKEKAGDGYRLVLLDTHAIHFTTSFLQYGIRNKIIFLFIPPSPSSPLNPLGCRSLSLLKSDIYCPAPPGHLESKEEPFIPSPRTVFDLISQKRHQVFTSTAIKEFWQTSGLVPYDPTQVSNNPEEPPMPAVAPGSILYVSYLPVKDLDVDILPLDGENTRKPSMDYQAQYRPKSTPGKKAVQPKANPVSPKARLDKVPGEMGIDSSLARASSASADNDADNLFSGPLPIINSEDYVSALQLAGEYLAKNKSLNDKHLEANQHLVLLLNRIRISLTELARNKDIICICHQEGSTVKNVELDGDSKGRNDLTVTALLSELDAAIGYPKTEISQLQAASLANGYMEKMLRGQYSKTFTVGAKTSKVVDSPKEASDSNGLPIPTVIPHKRKHDEANESYESYDGARSMSISSAVYSNGESSPASEVRQNLMSIHHLNNSALPPPLHQEVFVGHSHGTSVLGSLPPLTSLSGSPGKNPPGSEAGIGAMNHHGMPPIPTILPPLYGLGSVGSSAYAKPTSPISGASNSRAFSTLSQPSLPYSLPPPAITKEESLSDK